MTTLVLRIPHLTPSANEWAGRRSRWAYTEHKRRWLRLIGQAYYEARAELGRRARWVPEGRIRVTIERHGRCENGLDADNMAGGCKPVCDALRLTGLIRDDRCDAIELVLAQPRNERCNVPWTQITLERIEVE